MRRALLLVLPLLTACLAYEEAPEQEEVVEQALPDTEIRSTWSEAAAKGEVPDGWLKTFADPALEALIGEALKNNLTMRGIAARVQQAEGIAVQAAAGLKPMVGLGVPLSVGPRGPAVGVGINASWEVDLWGKLTARAEAGEELLEAAKADLDFARESLAAQTARTWFVAIEAKLQAKLASDAVGLATKTLEVVQAKERVGQITEQEVRLAQANLRQAQEREDAAEVAFKEVVRGLETLLGRYPAAELEVANDLSQAPAPFPAGLPSALLERRWDIVAAERRARAQFQNVQVAKLAQLPSLTLSVGGGASSQARDLTGDAGYWSVGANFFQPIYMGGALEAEVKIQTAIQEQVLVAYGQTALNAFREVEDGLNNDAVLAERAELLTAAQADYEEALKIARTKFRVGKTELLDVIQIEGKLVGARSAALNLRSQRLTQRVNLHMALGGGFELPKPEPQPDSE